MIIKAETDILLFRFNDFRKYDFIVEHLTLLKSNGFVWFLKAGRHSNKVKIDDIIEQGGYIVLRSPKAKGGHYYIGQFDNVSFSKPIDGIFPMYYSEFIEEMYSNEQWFRLKALEPLSSEQVNNLVLQKNRKKVDEVVSQTRTSVMFITCNKDIII